MSIFELTEPTYEPTPEPAPVDDSTPTARVIATSHIAIAVGDLIHAAKLLGRGEGFEGLHVIEQAQEHLNNATAQLNGRVWDISTRTDGDGIPFK